MGINRPMVDRRLITACFKVQSAKISVENMCCETTFLWYYMAGVQLTHAQTQTLTHTLKHKLSHTPNHGQSLLPHLYSNTTQFYHKRLRHKGLSWGLSASE